MSVCMIEFRCRCRCRRGGDKGGKWREMGSPFPLRTQYSLSYVCHALACNFFISFFLFPFIRSLSYCFEKDVFFRGFGFGFGFLEGEGGKVKKKRKGQLPVPQSAGAGVKKVI